MIQITDQTGNNLKFDDVPTTVLSLVPSITETLIFLGLGDKIVGRTKFCIHPFDIVNKIPKTGGTKNPDIRKIKSLKPDLIIANKEENRLEDIKALSDFSVYVSDIKTTSDINRFLEDISHIFQNSEAIKLGKDIESGFNTKPNKFINVCYLIWNDPWMTIGNDTFIHYMMDKSGYKNVYGELTRYPEISEDDIKNANPDVIMLSSEPYPFKEKHLNELKIIFPDKLIVLVDGEYFSWYGSRMLEAIPYMDSLYQQILRKLQN